MARFSTSMKIFRASSSFIFLLRSWLILSSQSARGESLRGSGISFGCYIFMCFFEEEVIILRE